jgi:hypothetical protein
MSRALHSFDDMFFGGLAADQGLLDSTRADDRAIADSIRASLNPVQLALLEDPARRKSALCPRRSGKSHAAMSYAFDTCLRKVGARVVVVTLTLKHAKNVYWFDMQKFANRFGVQGAKFYQNELRIIFRNSSQLWLIGAESRAEIEKLRGGQYDLIIVDECKSYHPGILLELYEEVSWPALTDRRGTFLMIGTPGNIMKGLFFETTYPGYTVENKDKTTRMIARDFNDPEPFWRDRPKNMRFWSRHHWTVEDNKAMDHLWDEMLEMKAFNHWSDDEPIWRREALGEWVNSVGSFVYAYASMLGTGEMTAAHWSPDFVAGNRFGLMPKEAEWRYLLGIDLGFDDHLALVVGAYNPADGVLYHVWEYHEPHLDVFDAVQRIDEAIERFGGFDTIVADTGGLGKMIIETLNKRYGYAIKPAEKTQKFDHIELLNADIRSGRAKIMPRSDLANQMAMLQYDLSKGAKEDLARNGRLKEHPGFPNDLCDAFLYLWRFSYHHYQDTRMTLAPVGSIEWQRDLERRAMDQLVRERTAGISSQVMAGWNNIDPLKDYYARN